MILAVYQDAGSRVRDLEKRSKDEPKNAELAVTLGEACLRENRVEDAAAAYARSAELDPRSELKSLYWEWLGGVREARGELEEALEAYFNWAESEPATVEPLDRVGTLLVRLQRWTDIVLLRPHYLRRREQSADPRLGESLALYGFVLDQLGSPEDVTPLERTYAALEADSRSVSMRYLMGVLFYRTEHLEAARAEFERVLELDVDGTWREERFALHWDSSAARLMLARIARLQGDPEEALAQLSESLRSRADDSERLEEVTSLLLDYRRYPEALQILPELEEASPGWVHQYRAEGLLGVGRVREAESSYLARLLEEESQEEEDEDGGAEGNGKHPAALARAEDELSRGKPQAALKGLLKVEGDSWQIHWIRARALVQLEQWSEALSSLEALVERRPALEEAWDLLAEAAVRSGQERLSALARVQRERLRVEPELPVGLLYPASSEGLAVGFLIQARSLTGRGELVVTGEGGEAASELARLAQTLLKTRFEALGLEDPAYRLLHLHVSTLYPRVGDSGRTARRPDTPEDGARPTLGEDAAGAILAALGLALASVDEEPLSGQVVLGRLDLDGRLLGPVDLGDPLAQLQGAGYAYRRLILPRSSASELLRTPPNLWLLPELVLAQGLEDLMQACLARPRAGG
ncbi:MAG: tetratricopeptide repeat protein [Candidatus Eremiobacterota bacterium]